MPSMILPCGTLLFAQDVPGADAGHDEGGGEIGGGDHMGETIGEGRVEDHLPPVGDVQHAHVVDA